ncbi:C40 family peptidase [Defluviitalea phaphyphila]|uniref:C40 family peptidase n=1 Tax=Defluviitalea phaphyphila TaxID=1473580 RepID=UPI00073177DA|nr:SH3 domain-containing C40 family peptidase [Defluviitalea phaphyphila]
MKKLNFFKIKIMIFSLIILFANNSLIYGNTNNSTSTYTTSFKYTWGMVNENGINIREYPYPNSKILGVCDKYTNLIVTGKYNKWYQVKYKDKSAWIYYMYLDAYPLYLIPEVDKKTKENILRWEIVNYAKQFLGTPYRYGGTNLKHGVDCSGFTQSVMKKFNILLNRCSKDQIKNGIPIKKENLKPADLVFFDTYGSNNGKISHVALYIGDNKIIHATSNGVKIDNLSQTYYQKTYVTAVSIIKLK